MIFDAVAISIGAQKSNPQKKARIGVNCTLFEVCSVCTRTMHKLESEVQSFVTPAVQSHGCWLGGWGAGLVGHGVQAALVTAWHFTSLMLLKVRYSSVLQLYFTGT